MMIQNFPDDLTRHEFWMDQALSQAEAALTQGEVPVGAVIVQNDRVIARARNCRQQEQDPCGHAELIALREAARVLGRWQLTDCTLYVTLEPCSMCAGAIGQSRLKQVVYGAFDPKAGCAGSVYELCGDRRLGHATQILGGIREDACLSLLKDFFTKRRSE